MPRITKEQCEQAINPIFVWMHRLATGYPESARITIDPSVLATPECRERFESSVVALARQLKLNVRIVIHDDGTGFVEATRGKSP